MTENDLDREIDIIQEHVIRGWVQTGDALICARCQRAYVPSQTSDSDLCGSCVPLRNLAIGDKSPQYAKCEYCGEDIRGKRNDSRFCKDSCRVLAYRRRRKGDSTTTRERAVRAESRRDIGKTLIRKQKSVRVASTR